MPLRNKQSVCICSFIPVDRQENNASCRDDGEGEAGSRDTYTVETSSHPGGIHVLRECELCVFGFRIVSQWGAPTLFQGTGHQNSL